MNSALLLSGGMDSVCLAFWLKPKYAFTIDYGQLAATAEMKASIAVCKSIGIEHIPIQIDCKFLGSGDLANEKSLDISPSPEWWPFRNQLLVTIAGMKAISLHIDELILGSVKNDDFHADGTTAFYRSMNDLMTLQEGSIKVSAPAIQMSTVDLINTSKIPMSVLAWAHSCHKSNYPCGSCRGCDKYVSVLQELGFD